jgi:hypothetical protein
MLLVIPDRSLKLNYDMLKLAGLLDVPATPLFKGERFQGVRRSLNPPYLSGYISDRSTKHIHMIAPTMRI